MTHVQKKHHVVERMRYANMVSRKTEGDSNRIVEQLYGLPLSYEYLENNNDMECDDAAASPADVQVGADDSTHPPRPKSKNNNNNSLKHFHIASVHLPSFGYTALVHMPKRYTINTLAVIYPSLHIKTLERNE